jgi:DNA-binding response OmpR family regulator
MTTGRDSALKGAEYSTRLLDDLTGGPHNEPVTPSQASESAPRVLIVDDDVSVTDTFSRMLRLEGYEVWAALSADEGLNLAQTHRPHAVILDLRMPLTSGLQFLRAIRAIPSLTNTPVAIVTGDYYLDEAQSNEIKELGAELRYKPLWLEELVTLARELLNIPVRD